MIGAVDKSLSALDESLASCLWRQSGTGRRGIIYSSSERTALRRNAPVFLFRRDKSRLYGSLDSYASCRDREA